MKIQTNVRAGSSKSKSSSYGSKSKSSSSSSYASRCVGYAPAPVVRCVGY